MFNMHDKVLIPWLMLMGSMASCQIGASPGNAEPPEQPSPLPRLVTSAMCPEANPPAPCDYLDRADAVVVARVEEVRALTTPLVVRDEASGQWLPASESDCRGVNVGLELHVERLEAYKGSVPNRFVVNIGYVAAADMSPAPGLDSDSNFEWIGPAEYAIQPGRTVGLLLFNNPDLDVWTTAGFPMFSLAVTQPFRFQDGIACPGSHPVESLTGTSAGDFEDLTESCGFSDTPDPDEHEWIWHEAGYTYAAVCRPIVADEPPSPQAGCLGGGPYGGCESEQICVDGVCYDEPPE